MGRQLVVTGMHRSGTSLVAGALGEAGVDLGGELIGGGIGNVRGHFEDRALVRLHEGLLADAGRNCFDAEGDLSPGGGSPGEQRAVALVAERQAKPLWGFKDPRSCLFLDLWGRLLPAAGWVFVYRHPVDVALSLWRRNLDLDRRRDPWLLDVDLERDPWLAIRSWEAHNRRLLAFRARHPERCFVAQVPALAADLPGFVGAVGRKLGLPLAAGAVSPRFVPGELTAATPANEEGWEAVIPGALALYRELEAVADLPGATIAAIAPTAVRDDRQLRLARAIYRALLASRAPAGDDAPPALVPALEELRGERVRVAWLEARLAESRAEAASALEELRGEHARAARLEARVAESSAEAASALEELRGERVRVAWLEARLSESRAEAAGVVAQRDATASVLAAIQRSRAFALVRGWWWLRRRLGRSPAGA